jgi:hypothetical protein
MNKIKTQNTLLIKKESDRWVSIIKILLNSDNKIICILIENKEV